MSSPRIKVLALLLTFVPLVFFVSVSFIIPSLVFAATSPSLGSAVGYSILAGSSVTNTGATTVSENVGISPGAGGSPNYTGFGTVTLGGVIHDADGTALTAQGDKNIAYNALASQECSTDYGAVTTELSGKNLVPGVYCSTSFHLSSGTLTLNGAASDVWIFKSASDLIITGGSSTKVSFIGGGQPCNVWWRVVSTATFDANSSLVGNILADTSITFAAGANLDGRALARTAAVTLSSNSITGPTCAAATNSTPTPTPTPTATPTGTPIGTATSEATPASTPNDICANIEGIQTSVPEGQHLDASGLNCVDWSQSGPPPQSGSNSGGGGTTTNTSTGQVLGASTLASTGSFNSSDSLALMLVGSVLTLGSLYVFKKRAI